MSDGGANEYDKLKKALFTKYNFTEDGYRKRFREIKPETEETPDPFVIRLTNYPAKWLELSGSSSGDFDALVDLNSLPAQERTQGLGRVNYMGSAVLDCTEAAVRGKTKSTVQSKA